MSAPSPDQAAALEAIEAGVTFETWVQRYGEADDWNRAVWAWAEKQAKQRAEWRAQADRAAAKRAAKLAEGWTEGPDGWIKPDGTPEHPPWKEKAAGRLGALPLEGDDRNNVTGAFRSGLIPGLHPSEALVWLFLLSTASEMPGRVVEASARYVGNGLGINYATASRALKKLTVLGLIKLRRPGRMRAGDEGGSPARYFVERVTAARVSQWRSALNREAAMGEEEK